VFEVAFASDPFASSPSYVDLTDHLSGGVFRSPQRSFELNQIDSASSEAPLENPDRRFEPEYASSPYYPNVIPVRKARLRAMLGSTTYDLWSGFVETWQVDWPAPAEARTPLTLLDAMEGLERLVLTGSFLQQTTGARIDAVLDAVGFPAGERLIDTGQETVQAKTFAATDQISALAHIRGVAATEGPTAAFFIDGAGRAVFHDRHRRLGSPYTVSQATFGDDPDAGEIPYESLQPNFSKDLIVNLAYATPEGGATQSAENTASQARYMRRSQSISTLHATDGAALNLCLFLVSRYAEPSLRFDAIEVAPLDNETIWQTILPLEIGDRVTVKRRPPQHPAGPGGVLSQQCVIEGIAWTFTADGLHDASVLYLLTPADLNSYWIAGDSANSLAGVSTRPAY
jgi:hypothetical protein